MSASPLVDEDGLKELAELLKEPRTVDELLEKLQISRPTLYRNFERLSNRGYRVVRSGISRPAEYQIK